MCNWRLRRAQRKNCTPEWAKRTRSAMQCQKCFDPIKGLSLLKQVHQKAHTQEHREEIISLFQFLTLIRPCALEIFTWSAPPCGADTLCDKHTTSSNNNNKHSWEKLLWQTKCRFTARQKLEAVVLSYLYGFAITVMQMPPRPRFLMLQNNLQQMPRIFLNATFMQLCGFSPMMP